MLESEVRPWGRYEVIEINETHKIKRIFVTPGHQLSYQRHKCRAEHWFFLSGQGLAIVDGHEIGVTTGSTVDIQIEQLHRIRNTGSEELIFIEVQTGTYFGEDDIERVEDDFGRV
jgi:mannose-6-phosphate isomerase